MAFILAERFKRYNAKIVYDQCNNHFAVKIDDLIYDITGDVTDEADWIEWDIFDDDLEKERIIRDCIMF